MGLTFGKIEKDCRTDRAADSLFYETKKSVILVAGDERNKTGEQA